MSYDIYLRTDDGKSIDLEQPHQLRGGTYALGGTREAWLNITYNYYPHFKKVFGEKGIRTIYGMTGQESIPLLTQAINSLKNDVDPNYWNATEGNARLALINLRLFAEAAPHGVWHGD